MLGNRSTMHGQERFEITRSYTLYKSIVLPLNEDILRAGGCNDLELEIRPKELA